MYYFIVIEFTSFVIIYECHQIRSFLTGGKLHHILTFKTTVVKLYGCFWKYAINMKMTDTTYA